MFFFLLQSIGMDVFAQLKPVPSGVIHWSDLTVKKDNHYTGKRSGAKTLSCTKR
jgi:hypothetical protein